MKLPKLKFTSGAEVKDFRRKINLNQTDFWSRVGTTPTENRHEVVECPVCNGRLHLSQSAYNGHVHGKCETHGCVSWME